MDRNVLKGLLIISLFVTTTPQDLKNEISSIDLQNSINFAKNVLERSKRLEQNLIWSNVHLQINQSDILNYYLQHEADIDDLEQAKYAYIILQATNQLKYTQCKRFKFFKEDCINFLKTHKINKDELILPYCERINKIECSKSSKYRSLDGSCNHPDDYIKGKSKTGYKRLLKANYLDGIERIQSLKLPSARKVALKLFKNGRGLPEGLNLTVLDWGEFILDDLSRTVSRKMVHTQERINCCSENGFNLSPRHTHPFCLPIQVSEDDEFFSKSNTRCISYVRSLPSISDDCSLGPLEQMNQATHYLDASQIYGSTPNSNSKSNQNTLRTFKDGLLTFNTNNNKILLSLNDLFIKEHNKIAENLKKLNPHWIDDILYEETRRIIIAEIQHITYNEFLPIILGERFYKRIRMVLKEDFNKNIDPRVSNSFATAAMRYFTSFYDYNNNKTKFGLDLLTLDIQRGRDHGLPTYTTYKKLCGLNKLKTFKNLYPIIHKNTINTLSELYRDPKDIDLIVGGFSERIFDGILGPTFSCIVSEQFLRTKRADRFFYSNKNQPKPFTDEQLNEIKRITLASIFCTSGNVKILQKNIFESINSRNELMDCENIPKIDLIYWKETLN